MSLRFVYGRAGCGKTHFCLNEIKKRIQEGSTAPIVLLVPEQFTFQTERDLISMLNTGGILKTEVLSFRRMAFRVFHEVGGITYPHIHPAGKNMVLYRIMDTMKSSLKMFAKSANQPGFVNTLSSLITEFKHYNVTKEKLSAAEKKLSKEPLLKDKLTELERIFTAFEKTIHDRYRDADDDLTLACEKLKSSVQYREAEVWLDGFTDFTPQEYRMIEQLLLQARRVTVTLTSDHLNQPTKELDLFASGKAAYHKLLNIAILNQIPMEPPSYLNQTPLYRFRKNPELFHLEQNLDAHPYAVYPQSPDNLSLFSAMNIFSEIEMTARDIIRLCRDEGFRFKDIAVVTRDLTRYEKLVEVVFNDYGIPFFIDKKIEAVNHPLVSLVLSMLDIFTEHWSYEAVFRYLKSGLTGIEQYKLDKLENYVLACGIRGSSWTDAKDWNMSMELLPDDKSFPEGVKLYEEINNTRRQIIAPLMEFRNRTKGKRTAAEFCTALYDFLCNLGVPERIEHFVEGFRQAGDLFLANAYSQVWNIVIEIMDQMVEVMAEETFGIERFANILKIGLEEYKIGLIPQSLDQVLVGSVERSKSHAIQALYVLGVNDGVFPANGGDEGILTDKDRSSLKNLGMELAKSTRAKALDEQFLVYRTLTTPSTYLRMSWSIADQEGRTLRPSTLITRIRKLFPKIKESSNILPPKSDQEVMEQVAVKGATFRQLLGVLRQRADGREMFPIWAEVYRWFYANEDWVEALDRARWIFQFRNTAQPVIKENIVSLYGEPLISSVSKLERYTACPFSFFVQFGLGARERKVFHLSPPDVGTFLHAAIERFSKCILPEGEDTDKHEKTVTWRTMDREWCENKVSEIIDSMLQGMNGAGISSSKRYTALTIRLKRVVTRAVWLISEHIRRSSFNPVDYEAGFGDGEKYPPITIELNTGECVKLFGRIDRVDALKTADGQYLRIVDYKSGSKHFKLANVYYGLQLQLITYLDAIWESTGQNPDTPVIPGGMLYFKVDDPIIKTDEKMNAEDIEVAIMKQLRMKGLLLADVKLIKEMDRTIDGSSHIIPAALNKGDVLGKSSSVATLEQFYLLRRYVRKLLKEMSTEVVKGSVSIRPIKNKEGVACKYCNYLPVCQFDTSMTENSYHILYEKNNDEIWDLLSEKGKKEL